MLQLACTALVLFGGIYVLLPLFRRGSNSLDVELLAETELDRLLDRR